MADTRYTETPSQNAKHHGGLANIRLYPWPEMRFYRFAAQLHGRGEHAVIDLPFFFGDEHLVDAFIRRQLGIDIFEYGGELVGDFFPIHFFCYVG